jgi:hypothetical protein
MTLIASGMEAGKHYVGRFSGEYRPWQWGDMLTPALLLLGFLLGAWMLFRLAKKYASTGSDRPRSPFSALVRAHGLSRSERASCQKVAAELGFADPAELFVRPETARIELAKIDEGLAQRVFC